MMISLDDSWEDSNIIDKLWVNKIKGKSWEIKWQGKCFKCNIQRLTRVT